MSAFIENYYNIIQSEIGNMFAHHQSFERSPLTHEDLMQLVVDPQDYDVVKRASSLFERYSFYKSDAAAFEVNVSDKLVDVAISQNASPSFLMPKYAKKLSPSAPPEVIHKLVEYLRDYTELSRQYGRVREVFRQLNLLCEAPSQVKFLWPAIELIVNQVKDNEQRKRMQTRISGNSRKSLPLVPAALRAACRETAATLAMWQMLPVSPTEPASATNVHITPLRYQDDLGTYSGM